MIFSLSYSIFIPATLWYSSFFPHPPFISATLSYSRFFDHPSLIPATFRWIFPHPYFIPAFQLLEHKNI
jgi:hypothetical protein